MKIPVLMYHCFSDKETDINYAVLAKNFEKQMEYLYDNGFTTVLPKNISTLVEQNYTKPIMITFDDGYETDYTIAYPVLKKYGFKGVSFITTGFINKTGYMTWEQVKKLKDEGFSIQSHTHTHSLLNSVSEEKVREELSVAKQLIEEKLNIKVSSLALPGGRYSEKTRKIAQETEYQYIFSSKPGINEISANFNLKETFNRVLISESITFEKFKKIVNLDKNIYQQEEIKYFIKGIFKKLIGNQRYHQLWNKYSK